MKAADRCPEHNQGDRCTLEKGHVDIACHIGNFSTWNTENDVEQNFPREYPRNRTQAREDRYRKAWIANAIRSVRLDALREIYVKPFTKKPQELSDALPEQNVDVPSV